MTKIPEDFETLSKLIAGLTVADFLSYAIAAGALWLLFYVVRRRSWRHRKVVPGYPPQKDIRREIALSALTCVIYSLVILLTLFAGLRGWTHLYLEVDSFGGWWFAASILITVFVHDAYFYWTHRLMHWRFLYPIMHRTHHLSTNPTPWAAYAFHPLEALLQAGILPLVVFAYPIHPLAFIIFMGIQIGFNVFGHAGFEIFPHWFLHSWMGKFLNTPTNHAMHHEYFRGNYGLYFNLWDRMMGTNQKNYQERFREVTLLPRDDRR